MTAKGFTALEILVSLAIMALLVVVSIGSFSKVQNTMYLDGAVESVSSLIREARSRTLASDGGSQFGVYFETKRAALFRGVSFSEGEPDNKVYNLPDKAEIININFPANSVVFKRMTGDTEVLGDVSIKLKNASNVKKILINEVGLIYVE
ncbi:MAG: prepilin-type N-terminal cleavage/methylation domain-containing protein [Patescibacteria group bacterium]